MNEPWHRAEADRVSDDTLAVNADVQGRWPAEPMGPELQELIWEDEKGARAALRCENMAAYTSMRRKIKEHIQGGGR
jgi:hypothetical protein